MLGYNPHVRFGNSDFLSILYTGALLLSALYLAVFMDCLVEVYLKTNFLYGFYRPNLLPGPFVDDRFTYPWYLLFFNALRITGIPALVWLFQDIESLVYSLLVYSLFSLFIALDILLLLALFVMGCFFCNNGVFRNGLCDVTNTTAYCLTFWKDQPDICNPGPDPPLEQCNLSPNPAFSNFVYFVSAFLALDLIITLYLWSVRRWAINSMRRANMILWNYVYRMINSEENIDGDRDPEYEGDQDTKAGKYFKKSAKEPEEAITNDTQVSNVEK